MEAVVSMLILSMFITTIVSIIRFSLVMSGDSIRTANENQNVVNLLVQGEYDTSALSEITFYSVDYTSPFPDIEISATHDIEINVAVDGGLNILAFKPD